MTDELARDEAFWKLVAALDAAGVLEHVMVIGTWAEWLYSGYFSAIAGAGDYRVDIGKTHDIDVYFRNYLMEIEGADRLKDDLQAAGFVPGSDFKGTFLSKRASGAFVGRRSERFSAKTWISAKRKS